MYLGVQAPVMRVPPRSRFPVPETGRGRTDAGRLRSERIVGGATPTSSPPPPTGLWDPLRSRDPSRDLRSKPASGAGWGGENVTHPGACALDPAWKRAVRAPPLPPAVLRPRGFGAAGPDGSSPTPAQTGETCACPRGWTRFFVERVSHGLRTTFTHPKPALHTQAYGNAPRCTDTEAATHAARRGKNRHLPSGAPAAMESSPRCRINFKKTENLLSLK